MNRIFLSFILASLSIWVLGQEMDGSMRGRIEHVKSGRPRQSLGQHRIGSSNMAPLRCMGSPRIPVILVQFPDLAFLEDKGNEGVNQLYEDFFNAAEGVPPGQSHCSVKEYFRSQSDGQFIPQFDIIGPVTLPQGYAYYGQDKGGAMDIRIHEFYRHACQQAIRGQIDWTLYDNDGNGTVDFVFFIYAGNGQNQQGMSSDYIWPKENMSSMTVKSDAQTGADEESSEPFSVTFGAYGCTNELYNGKIDGIGPCVHELCHGLGLPDFYDTNSVAYGMDYWDVMDSGCYKDGGYMPIGLSAYERDFFGWKPLVELDPDSAYYLTLRPLELDGVAYKVVNKANANEYFILENRQNIDTDLYLGWMNSYQYEEYGANHGLMITHVDYSSSAWVMNTVNSNKSHQRMTLVPADGELISSITRTDGVWCKSTHGDLYPGDENQTEMSSYAVFHGKALGQTINNITETTDGLIRLSINGGKPEDSYDSEDQEGLFEPDIPEIR